MIGGQGQSSVVHRNNKKMNKVAPLTLVPTTLEEAPLRRMDRRALNALRKRRADRHMIAFLIVIGSLLILLGLAAVISWRVFRYVWYSRLEGEAFKSSTRRVPIILVLVSCA